MVDSGNFKFRGRNGDLVGKTKFLRAGGRELSKPVQTGQLSVCGDGSSFVVMASPAKGIRAFFPKVLIAAEKEAALARRAELDRAADAKAKQDAALLARPKRRPGRRK